MQMVVNTYPNKVFESTIITSVLQQKKIVLTTALIEPKLTSIIPILLLHPGMSINETIDQWQP